MPGTGVKAGTEAHPAASKALVPILAIFRKSRLWSALTSSSPDAETATPKSKSGFALGSLSDTFGV
ncbi:MAG: hypothetical protein ABJC26_11840 [Gemmatimonadaceae bacterium]